METVRYLRALTRSWWVVVLTVLAGGTGGFLVYEHATPEYSATAQYVVKLQAPGLDAVSARSLAGVQAQALAQIAVQLPAKDAAFAAAGTHGAAPSISAGSGTNNPFLTVTVNDTDKLATARIANAYGKTLVDSANELVGRSGTPYTLRPVAAAVTPTAPYSPDLLRDVAFGLVAGLVLGAAIAMLREMFNRTVRESDELAELTGLTILGTVPRDLPKKLLPAMSDPRSARAEAYRQVRTTVLSQTDQRPLVVAVTSPSLGDGKTSVACNLAAIMCRAGHRVAIVDADLRRPRVAAFFELTPESGLSQVLAGTASLESAMTVREDGRLAIVPAGRIPQDPAELLGSDRMKHALAQLAEEYEFVIVDTPPVLPVADALVLAPLVDGLILVSRLGGTTAERIRRALSAIDRVQATMIGVVPNQAQIGADRDYRYSYRYTPSRRRVDDKDLMPTPKMWEQPAAIDEDDREPVEADTDSASTDDVQPPGEATGEPSDPEGDEIDEIDLPWQDESAPTAKRRRSRR